MTSLPPQDEPNIYEALADALIAASTAFLEAEVHFDASRPYMDQSLELLRQSELIDNEANATSERAYDLMSEYRELTDADPRGNIDQARALMAEVLETRRRTQALRAGAVALTQQALAESRQGQTIRDKGTRALRIGLERATTLLQQARRRPTNGDAPDALTA